MVFVLSVELFSLFDVGRLSGQILSSCCAGSLGCRAGFRVGFSFSASQWSMIRRFLTATRMMLLSASVAKARLICLPRCPGFRIPAMAAAHFFYHPILFLFVISGAPSPLVEDCSSSSTAVGFFVVVRREKVLNNSGPNDHGRVNNSGGMDDANSSATGAAVVERLSVISFFSLKEVLWMMKWRLSKLRHDGCDGWSADGA